jgi:hypothetical protein
MVLISQLDIFLFYIFKERVGCNLDTFQAFYVLFYVGFS